jgi:hypothetical protein
VPSLSRPRSRETSMLAPIKKNCKTFSLSKKFAQMKNKLLWPYFGPSGFFWSCVDASRLHNSRRLAALPDMDQLKSCTNFLAFKKQTLAWLLPPCIAYKGERCRCHYILLTIHSRAFAHQLVVINVPCPAPFLFHYTAFCWFPDPNRKYEFRPRRMVEGSFLR